MLMKATTTMGRAIRDTGKSCLDFGCLAVVHHFDFECDPAKAGGCLRETSLNVKFVKIVDF